MVQIAKPDPDENPQRTAQEWAELEEERIRESRRERGVLSVISGAIGDAFWGGVADRNGSNKE